MLSAARSSSLIHLTKRLSLSSITIYSGKTAGNVFTSAEPVRTFATKKKRRLRREKRLKALANPVEEKKPHQVDAQHVDWVSFQNSIAVDGFNTGQTTYVSSDVGKRHRGGVKYRAYLERKEAKMRPKEDILQLPGKDGQYPALRFSPEETKRLLDEAYAGIPKKTGKRGTKNLQRQSNRWYAVRKARKIHKKNSGILTHQRRMEKRSRIAREVRETKTEASFIREKEAMYQNHIIEKWTNIIFGEVMGRMNTISKSNRTDMIE